MQRHVDVDIPYLKSRCMSIAAPSSLLVGAVWDEAAIAAPTGFQKRFLK